MAGFAAFSAIVSKKLLRLGGKHIFYLASFGLVLTAFLFDIHLGWWGDKLPLVVIVLGAITILRAKKDLQVITFLTSYIILEFIFLRLSITDNLAALIPTAVLYFLVPYINDIVFLGFGICSSLVMYGLSAYRFSLSPNDKIMVSQFVSRLRLKAK